MKALGYSGWAVVGVALLVLIIRAAAGGTVDQSHVGVVAYFNNVNPNQTPLQPGYYSSNPFSGMSVIEVDTRPQRFNFPEVQGAGSDGQAIYYDVAVTYDILSSKAATLVIKGGTDNPAQHLLNTVMDPVLNSELKALSPKFSILPGAVDKNGDDIYVLNQRQALQNALDKALTTGVSAWGINILSISFTNIHADKAFQDAIEKTALAQQAKAKAIADGDAQVAAAQRSAAAAVASAQGQHDANALIQQSLTDGILKQQAIAKWDGHFPTTMGGGGDPFGLILQPK